MGTTYTPHSIFHWRFFYLKFLCAIKRKINPCENYMYMQNVVRIGDTIKALGISLVECKRNIMFLPL
jgi:hypothetical protein